MRVPALHFVTPAKAGVQTAPEQSMGGLDFSFRWKDG